jgi:bifunctional polynucleotide phosphatase/kinase
MFDFDWTLVRPKDDKTFPNAVDDWQWLRPCVPQVIKGLYAKGFAICIFTNQSKQWKQDQIVNALSSLDIPLTICIAFDKVEYKPSMHMFEDFKNNKKINLTSSFMCGDAVGRPTDHSDCDLKFAEAIGVKCVLPEDLFKTITTSNNHIVSSQIKEVIVLVGYPGSGKSTACSTLATASYFIANGDELKTAAKMIKAASTHVKDRSIVFDATNSSPAKRALYIEFAKKHALHVRCVHVTTPLDECLARNNKREKPIPRIAFNMYKKNFVEPMVEEGFDAIVKI